MAGVSPQGEAVKPMGIAKLEPALPRAQIVFESGFEIATVAHIDARSNPRGVEPPVPAIKVIGRAAAQSDAPDPRIYKDLGFCLKLRVGECRATGAACQLGADGDTARGERARHQPFGIA